MVSALLKADVRGGNAAAVLQSNFPEYFPPIEYHAVLEGGLFTFPWY